jgi:hypothetical protein
MSAGRASPNHWVSSVLPLLLVVLTITACHVANDGDMNLNNGMKIHPWRTSRRLRVPF